MDKIKNLEELFNLFPNFNYSNNIFHSACPYCSNMGETKISSRNKVIFVGEDRFIRDFRTYNTFYCSHCKIIVNVNDLAAHLGVELVEDFDDTLPLSILRERKEIYLTNEEYVNTLHSQCDFLYWNAFGWSDDIIKKFRLGYGHLYPHSVRSERHIIPFNPYTVEGKLDGWALEGRLPYGYVGEETRNIKTAGITKEYWWQITEGDSDTAYIVEGVKDGISAVAIGVGSDHIYAILGNATDREALATALTRGLYKKVIVCAHNDEAGLNYINDFVTHLTCEVYALQWPENAKSGYDLTDLLVDYGDEALDYVLHNLYAPQLEIPRTIVPDIRSVNPNYEPPEPSDYTSDVVREELPLVLDEFFTNYGLRRKAAGRGIIKVLAVDPGAGKSYAMVQAAEKLARLVMRDAQNTKSQLNQLIKNKEEQLLLIESNEELLDIQAQIQNLVSRRDNVSVAKILYAGPFINGWDDIQHLGADMGLWYNLEARNEDNCENLITVSALASKGYAANMFCQNACPFKERCKYLAQDKERKTKPITYVRHQTLNTNLLSEYRYIFIDENCLNIFDAPNTVDASQMYPANSFWQDYVEPDQRKLIIEFVDAVRMSMNANIGKPEIIYSGRNWMDLVNNQLLGQLTKILETIDPKNILEYQPPVVMGEDVDVNALPARCVPVIYEAMLRELPLYTSKTPNYNSTINLVNGQLEVYDLQQVHVASSHPIVIADGTSFPQLYDLLFDREIEIYAPPLYDKRTSTTIFYGSDFTRTSLLKQIGKSLKDFNSWLRENKVVVEDIFGEEFSLEELPIDENIYDSPTMKRVLSLLKMVAEKHKSVLFVTYKSIRLLVEKRMKDLYPDLNIQYGHYGSLRGTNRYKDVEAVLLVGCPRIGYDVLHRKIKAWASLTNKEFIPFRLTQKVAPYHGVGIYAGYPYITIDDDFADRFISMVEAGEVRQAMERIRLTTSQVPKTAYLAISRPAAKWITNLEPMVAVSNSADEERYEQAENYIRSIYTTTGRFPKYDTIKEKYRLSNQKIAAIIKEIKIES